MTTPRVSILMPVRNAAPWIDDCIQSIISQTLSDWELVAVDDHSTDESNEILKHWSKKDHRILFYHNRGSGIIDALQLALGYSIAPFISRMDADDIMPPKKLETLYELATREPKAIATGKVKYISDKPVSEGYLQYEQWLNERCENQDHWKWIYRECVIASANWVAPRDLIDLTNNVYPEDYDLVFQWYAKQIPIVSSKEVTHLWREHPDRTSRNSKHYQQEAFFKLKLRRFLELDRDPSRPLVIMGRNKKSKLCERSLKAASLPFILIDQSNLDLLTRLKQPQILVAVFPDQQIQSKIQQLLEHRELAMGKDWWWI